MAMKSYYRIMLGQKSVYAEEAYKGNFICTGFVRDVDLTKSLPDNWRDFNAKFIPVFQKQNPGKKKIAAGLACGMLWTIAKGIQVGDVVLCPDGKGAYYVGEVTGPYYYQKDHDLQHRRQVQWFPKTISRNEMSEALRNSTGAIGTVSNITKYVEEIEKLLAGTAPPPIIVVDQTIEDPSVFALEKHLEDFLVQNGSRRSWGSTTTSTATRMRQGSSTSPTPASSTSSR
jgi:restriction system protein